MRKRQCGAQALNSPRFQHTPHRAAQDQPINPCGAAEGGDDKNVTQGGEARTQGRQVGGVIKGDAGQEASINPAFEDCWQSEPPCREDQHEGFYRRQTGGIVEGIGVIAARSPGLRTGSKPSE